jgi:hypothetical protein
LQEVEVRRAEGFAVGTEQRGNGFRVRDGDAVGEDEVAADAEGGVAQGDFDGVVERGAGGHEGCGGERVGAVEFFDGSVDAGGEAEVVGVEDEARAHGA